MDYENIAEHNLKGILENAGLSEKQRLQALKGLRKDTRYLNLPITPQIDQEISTRKPVRHGIFSRTTKKVQ